MGPFQSCIYKTKYSKFNIFKWLSADGKKVWRQICMHHWRVYAKVSITKISSRCQKQGGCNQFSTFDPELRNGVMHWYQCNIKCTNSHVNGCIQIQNLKLFDGEKVTFACITAYIANVTSRIWGREGQSSLNIWSPLQNQK